MLKKMNKKLAFLVAVMAFGGTFTGAASFAADPQWCKVQCRGATGDAYERCYWGCVNNATGPH